MPVEIACPKCSKRYRLPESALGKSVKCQKCGTTFRTRKPDTKRSTAADRQPKPTVEPNMQHYGIDGGFATEADLFGSPPPSAEAMAGFGNFAGEDPGFDEEVISESVTTSQDDSSSANPYGAVLHNPALRQPKKSKGPGQKRQSGNANSTRIRKEHIRQETRIQQLGIVICGMAILATLVMGCSLVYGMTIGYEPNASSEVPVTNGRVYIPIAFGIVSFLMIFLVQAFWFFAGLGVYRLNIFGRIAGSIYFALVLFVFPVGTAISAVGLITLWNEPAKTIFSAEYGKIRQETPGIKHTSWFAAITLAVMVLAGATFAVLLWGLG